MYSDSLDIVEPKNKREFALEDLAKLLFALGLSPWLTFGEVEDYAQRYKPL